MSISSLADIEKKKSAPTAVPIITYILGIACVGLLVFFGGEIFKNIDNIKNRSALSADSLNQQADVYVNGKKLGETPFESSKLDPGENKISLRTANRQYETTINFISNNNNKVHNVGIFRDLGVSDIFSSGQNFWFEKDTTGNVIRVISEPAGAEVYIDGTKVGETPFSSNTLSEDNYDLEVVFANFEKQAARINVKKGYTLNVSMKLFPIPLPAEVKLFEGSADLYNVSLDNKTIVSDTKSWVAAVTYWNKTRGINLSGTGNNKELVFDYFLDYLGNTFDKDGNAVLVDTLGETKKGAYLGDLAAGGLTKEARDVYYKVLEARKVAATTATTTPAQTTTQPSGATSGIPLKTELL